MLFQKSYQDTAEIFFSHRSKTPRELNPLDAL